MKTEDLLQKYVTQGLSKDERFELEKRALEDDFLADAWEGLQVHQGSDLRQKWNAIQSEWQNKYKAVQKHETKVVAMRPWMRYAAAAAVLLLGAALFFMRSDNPTSESGSIVALDPIEATEDQSFRITTESSESTEAGSVEYNLEVREEAQKEKRILAETEKISALTKTSKDIASIETVAEKPQAATPQENSGATYVAKVQPETESNVVQPSFARTTSTPIPNPEPSAKGRAAIPIIQEIEDFGNTTVPNADESIVEVDRDKSDLKKSFEAELQTKETIEEVAVSYTKPKEGIALSTSKESESPVLKSAAQLKKNTLEKSKLAVSTDQEQIHLRKARLLFLNDKNYQGARDEALKAIAIDSDFSEGYELIGDIYVAASYTCGEDNWSQSLAVLAAVHKYKQAISVSPNAYTAKQISKKIGPLLARFPTKDDGFMRGAKPGDSIKVPCWIGETVTIRYK